MVEWRAATEPTTEMQSGMRWAHKLAAVALGVRNRCWMERRGFEVHR